MSQTGRPWSSDWTSNIKLWILVSGGVAMIVISQVWGLLTYGGFGIGLADEIGFLMILVGLIRIGWRKFAEWRDARAYYRNKAGR